MIFARNGNVNANIGRGALTIRGGVFAYGERRAVDNKDKGGNIVVGSAGGFNIFYDPDYMRFTFDDASAIVVSYLYRGVF